MPFTIVYREEENGHIWAVITAACRLDDANDLLIQSIIALIRRAYGEDSIMADAATALAAEINDGTFQTDHLLAAIRAGLPDPTAEGEKPSQLTTYRSQSAEMVAKAALATAYQFEYPAAPQEGATNPNQPILGFDGWGLLRREDGSNILALVQVKATDDRACPPGEAEKLAVECCRIPRDRSALCRALTVLARLLRHDPLQASIIRMLEILGRDRLPDIQIAPVIVRGIMNGQIGDLQPIRDVAVDFEPACGRGIVVTIGVPLKEFGMLVMQRAREIA